MFLLKSKGGISGLTKARNANREAVREEAETTLNSADNFLKAPQDNTSKEHFEQQSLLLKLIYENKHFNAPLRARAIFLRACILYQYSLVFDKNKHAYLRDKNCNKAVELWLRLPILLSSEKCCEPDAIQLLQETQKKLQSMESSLSNSFRLNLPVLKEGQHLLANILQAFMAQNFETVIEYAEPYVKRSYPKEGFNRYWVRYLAAVAFYHLYLAAQEHQDEYRAKAIEQFQCFESKYASSITHPLAFIETTGIDLRIFASVYHQTLISIENPPKKLSLRKNIAPIAFRAISPWHFNFDATLEKTFSKMKNEAKWHFGLTSKEVEHCQTQKSSHLVSSSGHFSNKENKHDIYIELTSRESLSKK